MSTSHLPNIANAPWWQRRDGYECTAKTFENFDFSKPDNWEKWKKRFEQFRVATGLKDENEPRQVSTLLYGGKIFVSVLCSRGITDADRKKCDAVMAKLV